MALDPVYNVIYPCQDYERSFPTRLQLWAATFLPLTVKQPHEVSFAESCRVHLQVFWCFARGSLLGGCRIGLTLPVLMRSCTMLVLPVASSAVAKASLYVRIKALAFLICSSVRRFQPSRKSSSTLVSLAFPLLGLDGSSSRRTTRSTGWYRSICKPF
jgi:hypothetical protein